MTSGPPSRMPAVSWTGTGIAGAGLTRRAPVSRTTAWFVELSPATSPPATRNRLAPSGTTASRATGEGSRNAVRRTVRWDGTGVAVGAGEGDAGALSAGGVVRDGEAGADDGSFVLLHPASSRAAAKIGRASCRERV